MASAALLAQRRRIRGLIFVLIGLTALATALLGLHYAGDRRAGRVDSAIDVRLRHRLHGHLRFLHYLVALADPGSVVAICALLAVLFVVVGRRRAALLVVLGPAVAAATSELILKPVIGRRLHDSLSFPSGHTTGAVSVAVVVVIVLLGPSRPGWPGLVRFAASGLAMLGGVAVATALVGSGYHYATDTLGGFCVAIGVVLSVALAVDAACGTSVRKVKP